MAAITERFQFNNAVPGGLVPSHLIDRKKFVKSVERYVRTLPRRWMHYDTHYLSSVLQQYRNRKEIHHETRTISSDTDSAT